MKNLIATVMLQVTVVCAMESEAELIRSQIKQLLAQTVSLMPPEDVLCATDCMEYGNYIRWIKSPEFAKLEEVVDGNWEAVLGNLEEVAPSEIQRFILFVSLQSLTQKDFSRCLNTIADLCLDNAVSTEEFLWTVFHYEGNTRPKHRLALNYKDPVVAEVLRKAKVIDPEHRDYYKWMASGVAKRELEHPLYYDSDTGEEPNITSVKSWAVFLGRMLARVAAVGVAVLGVIMAWRYFWRKKKQA